MRRHDDALGLSDESSDSAADPLMRRNIAYYQGASHAFKTGLLRWVGEGAKEVNETSSKLPESGSYSYLAHPEK
jgi:hypothetical protein